MTEIVLVRHGQANAQATTEEGYDQLSDLGRQQARWLGEYFEKNAGPFDRVICGTLNRQIDTAKEMGQSPDQDPRLNELRYYATAKALESAHQIKMPQVETDFKNHLPVLMRYWHKGLIEDAPETFEQFHMRIVTILSELAVKGGRSLVVTSGGAIGMVMQQVLDLNISTLSKVMLSIHNSSFHTIKLVDETLMLAGFNATPHLDGPKRAHARSFV